MSDGMQPADIRAAVAFQVAAVQGVNKESMVAFDFFRLPAHAPVHTNFAVRASPTTPMGDRQRPSSGALAATEVRVLLAWQLAQKNQTASLDEMLALQAKIRNALMIVGWNPGLQMRLGAQDYDPGPEGWLWSGQAFTAIHLLPLQ